MRYVRVTEVKSYPRGIELRGDQTDENWRFKETGAYLAITMNKEQMFDLLRLLLDRLQSEVDAGIDLLTIQLRKADPTVEPLVSRTKPTK